MWEGVSSPFDSLGTFDLNQGVYSVMSYNDGWQLNPDGLPTDALSGYEGTMMAFDIALLQQKYLNEQALILRSQEVARKEELIEARARAIDAAIFFAKLFVLLTLRSR